MNFLSAIPKAQKTKSTNIQIGLYQTQKVWTKLTTKYKDYKQNGRQYLQTTYKCLISKIYKEHIQVNNIKNNFKIGTETKRTFSQKIYIYDQQVHKILLNTINH